MAGAKYQTDKELGQSRSAAAICTENRLVVDEGWKAGRSKPIGLPLPASLSEPTYYMRRPAVLLLIVSAAAAAATGALQ